MPAEYKHFSKVFQFHRGGTTITLPQTSKLFKISAVILVTIIIFLIITFSKPADFEENIPVIEANIPDVSKLQVLDKVGMTIANFISPFLTIVPVMTDYIKLKYQVVDDDGNPLPPGSTKGDMDVVQLVNGMTTIIDDISILKGTIMTPCYQLALCIIKHCINRVRNIAQKNGDDSTKVSLLKAMEGVELIAYYTDNSNTIKSERGKNCKRRFQDNCPKANEIVWFDKINEN